MSYAGLFNDPYTFCIYCVSPGNNTERMFTPWSDWSDCSAGCDDRVRRRNRTCTAFTDCSGPTVEEQNCLRDDCPGHYSSLQQLVIISLQQYLSVINNYSSFYAACGSCLVRASDSDREIAGSQ